MNTIDTDLEKQLTRVYVALAMTRDAATRVVNSKPTEPELSSLLTLLDVASEALEKIFDPSLEVSPQESGNEVTEVEAIM
jgi:hypothetical protein